MDDITRKPSFSGRYAAMQANTSSVAPATVPRPKLGEILVGAELISDRTFYECLLHAEESSQRVGKVIVGMKYATDRDVDSALLIQSLIGEQKIKPQVGIQLLKDAAKQRKAVVDLLRTLGSVQNEGRIEGNYLGRFLSDCNLIGWEQLSQALAVSQEYDVQLIRVLLHNRSINIDMASKCLDALAQVKAGKLDYQLAVAAVQYANKSGATLREALRSCGLKGPQETGRMLLGEIIGRAGIASEMEILAAVETALSRGKRVGEALLAAGAVTPLTLQNALELQDLVIKGVIEQERALMILRRLVLEGRNLAEFANTTGIFRDEPEYYKGVLNVLYSSFIIAGGEIIAAYNEKADYGMDSTRALLATGRLNYKRFLMAKEILAMIQDNRVSQDLGLQALKVACSDNLSLYEALKAIEPKKRAVESAALQAQAENKSEPVTVSSKLPVSESVWQKAKKLFSR